MTRHTNVPPAPGRIRRWTPPLIGDWYVRISDGAAFQVGQVHKLDQQIQLKPDTGERPFHVFASELARDYRAYPFRPNGGAA